MDAKSSISDWEIRTSNSGLQRVDDDNDHDDDLYFIDPCDSESKNL